MRAVYYSVQGPKIQIILLINWDRTESDTEINLDAFSARES